MKRWNVIVELPAQQDIAECRLWIAARDAEAADRWFDSIYNTIGSLELFPERCPLAPEGKFLNSEIREIFHGRRQYKYRILFTVKENEVHVLHVRHGARLALGVAAPEEGF
jgi:plasmid stabilization system protein ParE